MTDMLVRGGGTPLEREALEASWNALFEYERQYAGMPVDAPAEVIPTAGQGALGEICSDYDMATIALSAGALAVYQETRPKLADMPTPSKQPFSRRYRAPKVLRADTLLRDTYSVKYSVTHGQEEVPLEVPTAVPDGFVLNPRLLQ